MRLPFLAIFLTCIVQVNAQFSCSVGSYNLTSSELGAISNNTMSYTYNASVFTMPYSIQIEKVAGNGPRLYRYTSTTGVWIGKDDDDESIQPPVQEYNDIVITFSGDVSSVYLDFMAINKNSDGEEQIQSIFPQTAAGSNITTGVSYFYEPGVPSGTTTGTYFRSTTKTIHANTGRVDNGRLHINSTTPFRKIRFRWKEISDLSYSGPNGIVLNRIQYCPVLPEIECLFANQLQSVLDTVSGPTLLPFQDSLLSFLIRNTGPATLNLSNISLSGSSFYQLLSPSLISILPGASSLIQVRYNPQSVGSHQCMLSFQSNDYSEPLYQIWVQSQCDGPLLQAQHLANILIHPAQINSATTLPGQRDSFSIVLRNIGSANLRVDSISYPNTIEWSLYRTWTQLNLALGQSDSFKVYYQPNTVGSSVFPIQILSNDVLNDSFQINFQGISLQPVVFNQSVCSQNLPYLWNGNSIQQSGTYYHLTSGYLGQDSLNQLNLIVNQSDTTRLQQSICAQHLPLQWNQMSLTQSGQYISVLQNQNACDSVVILQLNVVNSSSSIAYDSICANQLPYLWRGDSLYFTGIYADTTANSFGCDSIIELSLFVIAQPSDTQTVLLCSNQLPYAWNQISIVQSGSYQYTHPLASGCDSNSVLLFQVLPSDTIYLSRQICQSQLPLLWDGLYFNQAGQQVRQSINQLGCDSLTVYQLQVLPQVQTQLTRTVCQNQMPLYWNGILFYQGGQRTIYLNASNGCDSIVQMNLILQAPITDTLFHNVCQHELPYMWGQLQLQQTGWYSQNWILSNGCDSTIYLYLNVLSDTLIHQNLRICQNQLPYVWYGLTFNSADTQSIRLNSSLGCDSTLILHLEVDSSYRHVLQKSICQNELPYSWNGLIFNAADTQIVSYNSSSFCDSTVSYQLEVNAVTRSQQNIAINSNLLPFVWNGLSIQQSGLYSVLLVGSNGCDSIAELNINIIQAAPPRIRVNYDTIIIQALQNLSLPNLVINQSYQFTFGIQNIGLSPLIVSQVTENQTYSQILNSPLQSIQQLARDSFTVRIAPQTLGNQVITVSIFSNDPGTPIFDFKLAFKVVNGPAPEIEIFHLQSSLPNNASLSFVNQPVVLGQSKWVQLSVINNGTAPLYLYQVFSNHPNLRVDSTFSPVLAPLAQGFIMLELVPTQLGLQQYSLTLLNNDADESQTNIFLEFLVIQATAPEIEIFILNQLIANQTSHFMGTTALSSPLQQVVQIRNTGNSNLTISQMTWSGNSGFSILGATFPITIAPGNTNQISIRFNATQIGLSGSTLSISNNDADENPYRILFQAQVLPASLPNCNQCYELNVLTNPLNAAEWIDDKPRLSWQHEEGLQIHSYRLEIWESSGSGWIPVLVNGNTINQVLPGNGSLVVFQVSNPLSNFKEHRWKVTAFDAQNNPIACFIRTFLVQKKPQVPAWTCPHPNVPNFGSELGQFNNVPIYKNGGCVNGVYDPNTNTIATQYYNSNFGVNPYGWQCAELPPRYYRSRFKIMAGPGNGVDYHLVTGIGNNRRGFKRFENGLSTEPPAMDDILARNSNRHEFGHVVIAKGGPVNNNVNSTFRIIQQNAGSNLTAHINGSLPIKRTNGRYRITDQSQGIWLSWIRAKPELLVPGDQSNIALVHSTTPDFRWARHNNIKGYQFKLYRLSGTCYQLEQDIRINGNNFGSFQVPPLLVGETYKWTVENIFQVPNQTSNWNKRVKSYANYLRVSSQAMANRAFLPLLAVGSTEQNLWVQTLGSTLNGSEIWFKNDEDWLYLGATDFQSSTFLEATHLLPTDSLWIQRKGFFDLKLSLTEKLKARGKYYLPMFPNQENPMYLEVSLANKALFVSPHDIQLRVAGKGYSQYQLFYDDVLHPQIYTEQDTLVYLPYLEEGYQSVRVYAMNASDTIAVDYRFVVVDELVEKMSVQLLWEGEGKVDIYLDEQFYTKLEKSAQFFIPKSNYQLKVRAFGYQTQNFEIESDTLIELQLVQNDWILEQQTENIPAQQTVFYDMYVSLWSAQANRVEIKSDSSFMQDSLYVALSESIHFSRKEAGSGPFQMKWVIDRPLPDVELFLRYVENGNILFLPLLQPSVGMSYESDYQLVHLKDISADFSATVVQRKPNPLDDLSIGNLYIFPNPNQGNFSLYIPEVEGEADIEIFDMLGRLIYSENARAWINHSIEIQGEVFSAGNYILKVNTERKTYVGKVMIRGNKS